MGMMLTIGACLGFGLIGADAIDERPLPLEIVEAFPGMQWTGWTGETATGEVEQFRPLILTHAGDERIFLATQHGLIHQFRPKDTATTTFLDMRSKTVFADKRFEEGLLGLAFHPRFAQNRQFFLCYTDRQHQHVTVVARRRMLESDPSKVDPDFEERLLEIQKAFWNHNGGTIVFGPDGYLYVALGDGGAGHDPYDNGQNLATMFGKILRIDVDRAERGRKYGIPTDNPFVNQSGAMPEIYAYGLRNPWRIAFDRQTQHLWCADVGQDRWEEINLIKKGGNYGWSRREGLHPFGPKGTEASPDFVEPIWEYHHIAGRSITGGLVYRGQRVPQLQGAYLYADFVSGKLWALWYDEKSQRVTANRPIPSRPLAVLSFGEDVAGEAYVLIASPAGKGVFRFQ